MVTKLENFLEEVSEKTTQNNQYPVLTSSKNGLFLQDDYFNKQVASKDNTGYKIIRRGEFTYRAMSDTGEFFPNMLECTEIGIVSPAYPVFRITNDMIIPNYLKYYFRSSGFQRSIISFVQGSTRASMKFGKMKTISIDLPEKKVQAKVVKVLDLVKDEIDNKTKELDKLDNLVKARFVEMFCSEKCAILQDLSDKITDGSHMPPKGVEKSDYLMLSSQNIFDEINCDGARFLSKEDFESENKRTDIMDGDVLITIVGTIGRTHVVRSGEKYVFQRSVGVIKPKRNKLNGVYLASYLQTDKAKAFLVSGAHGSSQKGIYLQDLKKLPIPLASIELQNQFATFVSRVDKSKFVIQKSLEKTQLLFDSLMQEYFG